jgi:hypothetical protein
MGDWRAIVLAPSMPLLSDAGDDVTENSIVVMLRYGMFRELFLGDAGEANPAYSCETPRGPSTEPVLSGVEGLGTTECHDDLQCRTP